VAVKFSIDTAPVGTMCAFVKDIDLCPMGTVGIVVDMFSDSSVFSSLMAVKSPCSDCGWMLSEVKCIFQTTSDRVSVHHPTGAHVTRLIPGTVIIRRTIRNNDEDLVELVTFDGRDYGVCPFDAPTPYAVTYQYTSDVNMNEQQLELLKRACWLLNLRADLVDGDLQSVELLDTDLKPIYRARVAEADAIIDRATTATVRERCALAGVTNATQD
jgi:hypothetical protein